MGQRLSEQGLLVSAEKLKGDAFVLEGDKVARLDQRPVGERVLGGYFLIKAPTMERAREIASTHPHLKYGGEVEVRPLDLHDGS